MISFKTITSGVLGLVFSLLIIPVALAQGSANVVMYHRFGEDTHPSTNTTLEQFDAHIEELLSGGYTVLPLDDLVAKLRNKEEIADKTVAITMDDGYVSIYTNAYPRLKKAGLPFTIFLSTDAIDRGYPSHMSWAQVQELAKDPLVSIAAHTASHLHMATASQARLGDEMARSLDRLEEKLKARPVIFAYPFGEASLQAVSVVRGFGMQAAFGQHSGSLSYDSDLFYLPRFALNETYGDLDRFKMVTQAKALSVSDFTPKDMMVGSRNPPIIGFTLNNQEINSDRLACFSSHQGRVAVEQLSETRVELRFDKALPVGRTRLNCTVPAGEGRWYWFGHQFYVAP